MCYSCLVLGHFFVFANVCEVRVDLISPGAPEDTSQAEEAALAALSEQLAAGAHFCFSFQGCA